MSNTIQLRGDYERYEDVVATGQTLVPGQLVEVDANGLSAVSADAAVEKAFVVENALAGGDITDTITEDNVAQYNIQKKGNRVYAWFVNAGTATIDRGTLVGPSTIPGVLDTASANPIASLDEEVEATAGTPLRVKIRIL